jgi:hypothetical protein
LDVQSSSTIRRKQLERRSTSAPGALAGDFDGAIAALECAVEAEVRYPLHRTAARLDLALLVALTQRHDLYDLALMRLESEAVVPIDDQILSALIAQALIRGERGEDVSAIAQAALVALCAPNGQSQELPAYLSPAAIRRRLEAVS